MAEARPKLAFWRPFQPLDDAPRAREAARQAATGAWLIALSYALLAGLGLAGVPLPGLEPVEPEADILLGGVLALVAGGFALFLSRRQPLWAVLAVAVWRLAEAALKLLLVLELAGGQSGGGGGTAVGPLLVAVMVVLLVVLSVRGALALRRLRGAGEA